MELRGRSSSARTFSTRQLSSRRGEHVHVPDIRLKNKTFKSTARQVWMANVIAKQRTIGSSKAAQNDEKKAKKNTENSTDSISTRPPSVKRKGTPEIFPMSSEMKKTLLMLGNLDFLPEEERLQQRASNDAEKKISVSKFRQKTRQKIIQPQRFLRGMRSSTLKKELSAKEKESGFENAATADDIINSKNDNLENDFDQEKSSDKNIMKIECFTEEEDSNNSIIDEEKLEQKDKPHETQVISSQIKTPDEKHLWKKSYQKFQTVNTFGNLLSSRKTNSAKVLNFKRSRKIHLSETWQPSTEFPALRVHLPMRRAVSLGFENTIITDRSEQTSDKDLSSREKRTIEEIITDIQLRCSRWFEFRQRVLKQKEHR